MMLHFDQKQPVATQEANITYEFAIQVLSLHMSDTALSFMLVGS